MKCPKCNNEIPDFSKQCDICGVEIMDKNVLSNANPRNKDFDGIFKKIYFLIIGGIFISFGSFIISQFGLMFLKNNMFPLAGFSGIGLCLVGQGIGFVISGFNDKIGTKIMTIFAHGYSFSFLFFWFGILLTGDIILFKETPIKEAMPLFLFTLIFWAFGIIFLVSTIKGLIESLKK